MKVQKATMNEIGAVIKITNEIVTEMKTSDCNLCQWTEAYPTVDVYKDDIENGNLFVCIDNDEVVGFICLNDDQASEYSSLIWPAGKYVVIHRTGVSTNSRSKGVAIKMLEFAHEFAKENNYKVIRTDTFSKNIRMNKLFNKMGYEHIGQVYFNDEAVTNPDVPFNCYCKVIK